MRNVWVCFMSERLGDEMSRYVTRKDITANTTCWTNDGLRLGHSQYFHTNQILDVISFWLMLGERLRRRRNNEAKCVYTVDQTAYLYCQYARQVENWWLTLQKKISVLDYHRWLITVRRPGPVLWLCKSTAATEVDDLPNKTNDQLIHKNKFHFIVTVSYKHILS